MRDGLGRTGDSRRWQLLLSLIAPRPLYVASAIGDGVVRPAWGNPIGLERQPSLRVVGKKGLVGTTMPAVDQPMLQGNVAYHVRSGIHDVTAFDWNEYLDFLD